MEIIITKHAYEKLKERTNYSPTRAKEVVEEAYYCGKDIKDFPKKTRAYLENVLKASTGDCLKVLGNDIYLFGNGCLITTFPFPSKVISNKNKEGKHGKNKKDF